MLKKLLISLLALCLAFSLASCGGDEAVTTAPAGEQSVGATGLPEYDFGQYEFNILSVGRGNVCTDDFAYEEDSSNLLDQAIYSRNLEVENLYNVKIKTQWKDTTANQRSPEGFQTLMREATSGDTTYDLCVIPGYDVSELAYNGYLTDLNKLPHFDGTATWYDQKAVETFTFGDSLFFTAGDYGINLMDQTYCIAFNKNLAADYGVEDLYSLVKGNKWTLEKMNEIAKSIANPENNLYGNLYWVDSIYGALNAADRQLVVLDEATLNYRLAANDETTINVLRDFYEMVMNESISLKYQHNSTAKEYVDIFSGNQALFFLTTIGTLADFRDMDTDYGILPYFLYSENQQEYHNTVAPFYMNYMCVPLVVENYQRTSAVMEAIGYYSEHEIIPAYYDKTLNGKYVRDAESSAMLDIIFDTRAYDLGYCYQPAHINKHLIYMLNEQKNDWASRYASLEGQAQALLDVISMEYREAIGK